MTKRFTKPFTQQEPLPQAAIERAVEILNSGRLHRYNTSEGEIAEAAMLEREYADWQGINYCLACTSGGYAMQIALRSCGIQPGEKVLTNAYTLAPVPGAIHASGGVPLFVESSEDWKIDLDDLAGKAEATGARFLMLSHMRGHIADMDRVTEICDLHDIILIEDCAHTMGARWKGVRSGNFGKVACFSSQTYKHMNSGEGGLLTTNDPEVAARAIIHSGSYMLYQRHGTPPPEEVFQRIRLETPNMSGRMDNLRASLLRAQLVDLDHNIARWNERYQVLEHGLRKSKKLRLPDRPQHEAYVGSSIQFQVLEPEEQKIRDFIAGCANAGVEIKWFGDAEPKAFTSRYDSWAYVAENPRLPKTDAILAGTCDLRVPLTFDLDDCRLVSEIVCDQAENMQ